MALPHWRCQATELWGRQSLGVARIILLMPTPQQNPGGTTLRVVLCHHVQMLHLDPGCILPWNKSSGASLQDHFVVRRSTTWTVPTVSLAEARPLVGNAKGSRKHTLGLSHIWDRARTSEPESSPGSFQAERTGTGASHLSSRLSECSRVRS